jgi:ketosteroid isomerase-like protein
MSGANIELVRHVYEHWISGDFSRGDAFDPEVEFEMPDWPEGTRTRGREAMARTWLGTLAAWEDFRAAPGEFFEAGDRVVVVTHVRGRGRGSGIETRAETATVWTIRDRKVVHLALYWDVAKAFDVAGLDRRLAEDTKSRPGA